MTRTICDHGLEEAVVASHGLVVVAFLQHGSIPCRHFLPEFEAVAEALEGRAVFLRLEVTENPTAAEETDVSAVPTTVVWRDGAEVGRFEGPYSRDSLARRIEVLLKTR